MGTIIPYTGDKAERRALAAVRLGEQGHLEEGRVLRVEDGIVGAGCIVWGGDWRVYGAQGTAAWASDLESEDSAVGEVVRAERAREHLSESIRPMAALGSLVRQADFYARKATGDAKQITFYGHAHERRAPSRTFVSDAIWMAIARNCGPAWDETEDDIAKAAGWVAYVAEVPAELAARGLEWVHRYRAADAGARDDDEPGDGIDRPRTETSDRDVRANLAALAEDAARALSDDTVGGDAMTTRSGVESQVDNILVIVVGTKEEPVSWWMLSERERDRIRRIAANSLTLLLDRVQMASAAAVGGDPIGGLEALEAKALEIPRADVETQEALERQGIDMFRRMLEAMSVLYFEVVRSNVAKPSPDELAAALSYTRGLLIQLEKGEAAAKAGGQ